MDYIALGHRHSFSGINIAGRTHFAYSGCPQGRGFDELDEKGKYNVYGANGIIGKYNKYKAYIYYPDEVVEGTDETGYSKMFCRSRKR